MCNMSIQYSISLLYCIHIAIVTPLHSATRSTNPLHTPKLLYTCQILPPVTKQLPGLDYSLEQKIFIYSSSVYRIAMEPTLQADHRDLAMT